MLENLEEGSVRQALEAQLQAGETLLACTQGQMTGVVQGVPYYLGLTEARLLLVPQKLANQSVGIYRAHIKALKLTWAGFSADRLQVKLLHDTLLVSIGGGQWRRRAQELVRVGAQEAASPVSMGIAATRQSLVRQAQDFQALGFLASAQRVLNDAAQWDPALSLDPAVEPLQKQLAETRLAYRVGAGFLFAYVGVMALFAGLLVLMGEGLAGFDLYTLVSIGLALYFGVALWLGQSEQRQPTIFGVSLGFVATFFGNIPDINFINLITGLSFAGAIVLVLTGQSNRRRTWLAIAIYVFGYLGVMALAMFLFLVVALFEAL